MRILTLVLFFLASSTVFAQTTYTTTSGGNWTTTTIWSPNGSPGSLSNDIVVLNNATSTVTLGSASLTIGSLSTQGTTQTNTLSLTSTSLTVGGNITTGSAGGSNTVININGTSTLHATGNLNATGTVTVNVDGTLKIDGSVSGTVSYFGTGTVIIGSTTFHPNGSGGLPVELIDFKVESSSEITRLNWSTASELNFDYFTVEKSTDGINFHEIGQIAGHGTTSLKHSYSLVDEKPVLGRSYYRLMETDLDKSVTHLKTISSDFTGAKNLKLYPNPIVNGQVTMELNFVPSQEVAVSILDLRGVKLTEFALSQQSLTVPLQVASGTYLVVMRGNNFKTVNRLVVK